MADQETPQPEASQEAPPPEVAPQEAPQYIPPPPSVAAPMPVAGPQPLRKRAALAAFLSFIPGLGNIYNGLYRRGIVFFLTVVTFFAMAVNSSEEENAFIVPCLVFSLFFNIFDAYRQATLINYGYTAQTAVADEANIFNFGGWGIAPGVVLVVLGLYGLLRRYSDFDLSWIFGHWPFIIIAGGAWMIYQGIRERAGNDAEAV